MFETCTLILIIIAINLSNVWFISKYVDSKIKSLQDILKPNIKWVKVHKDAKIPTRTDGNAGYDVYAILPDGADFIRLEPNEICILQSGLKYELTEGWHMIAKERGSTGKIGLSVRAGVNDNNYRGDVNIILNNTSRFPIVIRRASSLLRTTKVSMNATEQVIEFSDTKAVCQLMPVYSPPGTSIEVDESELSITERGEGKFGSSNK